MAKKEKKFKHNKNSVESFENKIKTFLLKSGRKPIPFKELASKCRAGKGDLRTFNEAVTNLVKAGEIHERKRGFVRCELLGYFKAKILRLNRTFGFM